MATTQWRIRYEARSVSNDPLKPVDSLLRLIEVLLGAQESRIGCLIHMVITRTNVCSMSKIALSLRAIKLNVLPK